MRLIDADSIRGCAKYIKINEKFEPYIMIDDLLKLLDEQPTVYDIDKIVEEFEKIRAKETCNKEKCDTKELCRICVVDDAIEIVKQGDVGKES